MRRRCGTADGATRAAAAILLAAAARDVAVVSDHRGGPLSIAEGELRGALARGPLPELQIALAQVLIAQVADERGRAAESMPVEWLLLPEVDRLHGLGGQPEQPLDDPRIDEAAALVVRAEQAGAVPTRTDAAIASLRDVAAGARLRARWALQPGVLEARQLAYGMAPADPAAVLGLAAALEGRGSAETAEAIRAEASRRGVPLLR